MAETFAVRCPACGRENAYAPPVFPCACGSPVTPPLDRVASPVPLTHRNWSETWVAVRCTACGRRDEWPQPEVGCSCGTVVRLPVTPPEAMDTPVAPPAARPAREDAAAAAPAPPDPAPDAAEPRGEGARDSVPAPGVRGPAHIPLPVTGPVPRPAFRPVTIRTARDAVATAALYLRWLGFQDVRQPDARPVPSAAVDLRAPGLVAQVDPTTAPAGLRAVECVWLNGLTASATSVYFSLAGYTEDARARADDLGIPLFVMDLTGMPQPVNDPADELVGTGA
ncbi:hypothetical protein ACIQUQ_33660 [Streptomyces sp. NPDC101118]|uniref:hypothetical protein n=1 Tax=Streptomyces sp. NPDC101118 TaxID=3366109 RepID=UPI00380AE6F5